MNEHISRRDLIVGVGTASAAMAVARATPAAAQVPGEQLGGPTVAIFPIRLYDSRIDEILPGRRKFQPGDAVAVHVSPAYPDSPSGFALALFGNLTVTETEGAGFLSVAPDDLSGQGPAPVHSNINWWQSGITTANSFLSQIGGEHGIVIRCSGGRTHVVVDAFGYIPLLAPT